MDSIVKKFNEKVQILNQSGSKELTLGAKEARELHHAIFNMLERISELEKAKAILLEHEADYLLRQSTVEQVDKVALKKVTEVSPKSSARHARVTEYHRALYIRACWWSSDLSQAS
jgi:hypothetical protein